MNYNYPIDGGPDSLLSTPVVKAPEDPNFSNEPLEVAVVIWTDVSPPFSLSLRFDDDLLTKRLSLSLSDKRRRSLALFDPFPLVFDATAVVVPTWGMLTGMSVEEVTWGNNWCVCAALVCPALIWTGAWFLIMLCKNEWWSVETFPEGMFAAWKFTCDDGKTGDGIGIVLACAE